MKKFKAKKRLTALVVAFMLVFVTGSAFALLAGALDIVGTVWIEADIVVWESVEITTEFVNGVETLGIANAEIEARPGPSGFDEQRIVWTVDFTNASPDATGPAPRFLPQLTQDTVVEMTATMRNQSTIGALIHGAEMEYNEELAERLGLTFAMNDDMVAGETLGAGLESGEIYVGVGWDASAMNPEDDDDLFIEITITFDYDPA